MPADPQHPGVFVQELTNTGNIQGCPTSIAAFIGRAPMGSTTQAQAVSSFAEFTQLYGGLAANCPMSYAVQDFFRNGGTQAVIARLFRPVAGSGGTAGGGAGNDGAGDFLTPADYLGDPILKTGLYMLDPPVVFNLLCIPSDRRIPADPTQPQQDLDLAVRQAAAVFATERRAFYIMDSPASWTALVQQGKIDQISLDALGIASVPVARNAAVYFPRIVEPDPLQNGEVCTFAPCGAIAGLFAATDTTVGVWKAPAGISMPFSGVAGLEMNLDDNQNGVLNPLGINCLRTFPIVGPVIWGARTLRGADPLDDDYKYLSVRRLALYIETSILQGTQWAVFEPNNQKLWSALQLSVTAFLTNLKNQGAFYGFAVQCDASTTTISDIENGVVNMIVQISPVEPAEFIEIEIQQRAGLG